MKGDNPVLLINIGEDFTELVVIKNGEMHEKANVDIGVSTVNQQFKYSAYSLEDAISWIKNKLPSFSYSSELTLALYSGELTYMRLADYPLQSNSLFADQDYPNIIGTTDFSKRNVDIFNKLTLKELEQLLSNDSNWVHEARGHLVLGHAICEQYGISTVVPFGSNLARGVICQEFRQVTLIGSFRKHLEYILNIRNQLVKLGVQVLSPPRFTEPKNLDEEFIIFEGEEGLSPLQIERHPLNSINVGDALIVCSKDGYVGASAMLEIGYAQALGKRIIFTEKPNEFLLNILPAEVDPIV
jgi:hypothetical protein